eukprot:m.176351 g.176351  ORF g.176351 m.176351 type:complete len:499 (+) comp15443_c3_seq5:114-1610(+)
MDDQNRLAMTSQNLTVGGKSIQDYVWRERIRNGKIVYIGHCWHCDAKEEQPSNKAVGNMIFSMCVAQRKQRKQRCIWTSCFQRNLRVLKEHLKEHLEEHKIEKKFPPEFFKAPPLMFALLNFMLGSTEVDTCCDAMEKLKNEFKQEKIQAEQNCRSMADEFLINLFNEMEVHSKNACPYLESKMNERKPQHKLDVNKVWAIKKHIDSDWNATENVLNVHGQNSPVESTSSNGSQLLDNDVINLKRRIQSIQAQVTRLTQPWDHETPTQYINDLKPHIEAVEKNLNAWENIQDPLLREFLQVMVGMEVPPRETGVPMDIDDNMILSCHSDFTNGSIIMTTSIVVKNKSILDCCEHFQTGFQEIEQRIANNIIIPKSRSTNFEVDAKNIKVFVKDSKLCFQIHILNFREKESEKFQSIHKKDEDLIDKKRTEEGIVSLIKAALYQSANPPNENEIFETFGLFQNIEDLTSLKADINNFLRKTALQNKIGYRASSTCFAKC